MTRSPIMQLPDQPNLRRLEDQAKDLVKESGDSLGDAHLTIARRYGFSSWLKLEAYVESIKNGGMGELEQAILDESIAEIGALLEEDPGLIHREGHWVKRRRHNGYRPLAYAAFFGKVEAMGALIAAGANVHDGDEKALRAATYSEHYQGAIELLIRHGADPNATTTTGRSYKVIDYPCMLLAPGALKCLLSNGAQLTPRSIGFVVAANERNPQGKAECLDVIEKNGFPLPNTAPMALHCCDTGRLETHLRQEPRLLSKVFTEAEIFPSEFGIKHPSTSAYVTPLIGGVTLLHLAVEFCDLKMAEWLLRHGADNAPSSVDEKGFGGWTPLFHAMVTLHNPRSFPELAALLLNHGADPTVRASVRKPTIDDDYKWVTWENVTAAEYARDFIYPDLVNQSALELVQ